MSEPEYFDLNKLRPVPIRNGILRGILLMSIACDLLLVREIGLGRLAVRGMSETFPNSY